MEPSGNAKAAATDSRSGVSGLISSRAGTAQRIADLDFKNMPGGRVTQRGGFALRGADHIAPGQQELARTHPELFRLLTVVSAFLISKKQTLKLSENGFVAALNVGDIFGHAFR